MPDAFKVPYGHLTPQGMRQRFLLGKHNRRRYSETYKLLGQTDSPREDPLYVQSTDFYRTIQSAYAQLLGHMYDDIAKALTQKLDFPKGPGKSMARGSLLLLPKNAIVSLSEEEDRRKVGAVLPFGVRRRKQIQESLLSQSVSEGFIPVPVYVHMSSAERMDGATCKYARDQAGKLRKLDSTYVPHLQLIDHLKEPMKQIYKLNTT